MAQADVDIAVIASDAIMLGVYGSKCVNKYIIKEIHVNCIENKKYKLFFLSKLCQVMAGNSI